MDCVGAGIWLRDRPKAEARRLVDVQRVAGHRVLTPLIVGHRERRVQIPTEARILLQLVRPAEWAALSEDRTAVREGYLPVHIARAIAIDGSGRVWIGSVNGLHVYDEGTWISYTEDNSNILENPINCITFDHGGNVWVGHPGGASVFDGETWINYPWEHGFPNFPETYPDDVQAITVDSEGRILFASASALRIFDGDVWLEYNSRNSGYAGGAYDIAIDPEGDIWIASSRGILVASVDSSGLPQLVSQKRVDTASYLSWSFLSTPIAIMTLLWLAIFLKDIVLLIVGAIAGLGWVIAVPNPVPKGDFYVGPLYGWQPIVGGIIGSIVRKLRKTTSVIPTIIGMVVGGALSCLLWIRLILYAIMI